MYFSVLGGRIGQQATMIMYAVTLGVLGFILYKASSMVPVRAIPPPQNVRVVRRQSRSPKPPPPQPSTGDDEDTE
ncbi:hypothetical protein GCK72_011748 [Caenorhabditis remanei]|uniref:Uncharacterized protein n=1 Tax=Caenorhabditis remanei TaxID=31234 RepID=A0A6A5HAT9_CAERE|nr:hypothetical protein GCK72_011748 [Caenorhabditis remanei]KAF1763482.1 hypothetical protein GCK72_011748 [Caenorhabditis remanei]